MPAKSNTDKLTKKELVAMIAKKTGNSETATNAFFDGLEAVMKDWLSKENRAIDAIPGYMQFRVVKKDATTERKGRNPKTGKEITIASKPQRLALTSKRLTSFSSFFGATKKYPPKI